MFIFNYVCVVFFVVIICVFLVIVGSINVSFIWDSVLWVGFFWDLVKVFWVIWFVGFYFGFWVMKYCIFFVFIVCFVLGIVIIVVERDFVVCVENIIKLKFVIR